MLQILAGELAEVIEQLLDTLWAWKIETESVAKGRLWQQLMVLHEMHRSGFIKVSAQIEAEREEAWILSESAISRAAVSRR